MFPGHSSSGPKHPIPPGDVECPPCGCTSATGLLACTALSLQFLAGTVTACADASCCARPFPERSHTGLLRCLMTKPWSAAMNCGSRRWAIKALGVSLLMPLYGRLHNLERSWVSRAVFPINSCLHASTDILQGRHGHVVLHEVCFSNTIIALRSTETL